MPPAVEHRHSTTRRNVHVPSRPRPRSRCRFGPRHHARLASGQPPASPAPARRHRRWHGWRRRIAEGELRQVTSVLVADGDGLLYERYFDGADRDTRHDLRSATKSWTALLIGIALDRGELPGVDTRVMPLFADRGPFAHPDPAQGGDHRRGLPHHELAPRVRRLERVLARQRGADVPHRGLGPLRPRPADQGLPHRGRRPRRPATAAPFPTAPPAWRPSGGPRDARPDASSRTTPATISSRRSASAR